jgi:hypothetical protein
MSALSTNESASQRRRMASSLDRPASLSSKESEPNLCRGFIITSVISVIAWIICETLGGLLFLALGIRLWAYHITPIFWAIASYTGWAFVFFVAGINCIAYLHLERLVGIAGWKRWLSRSLFFAVAGPFCEVIWNHATWNLVGTPIYLYTVCPTFSGSGSLFSPLYYQTLLLGFWVEERIPGSLARGGA